MKLFTRVVLNRLPIAGLIVILGVCAFVYSPGLDSGFLFDDNIAITDNRHLKFEQLGFASLWEASLSSESGPLGRPLTMLTFALNMHYSGASGLAFKITNLIVHASTGAAIFVLALLLAGASGSSTTSSEAVRRRVFALICASLWLLHPFNLSAVLYATQRMASLSTFFMVAGLCFYVAARTRYTQIGKQLIATGIFICGALALLAKETGALLPLFALIIEFVFFRFAPAGNVGRRFLISLFAMIIILPGAALLAFLVLRPDWLGSLYEMRTFSLGERLLTEARVVLFYLRMSLLPDINQMGLQHDDIVLSSSWLSPPTTLPAVVVCAMLPPLAIFLRERYRVLSFAILWFFAAHVLESTILPLEIAHEHRNYLALFGPVFAVAHFLTSRQLRYPLPRQILAIAIIGFLAVQTEDRARAWGGRASHVAHELQNHPLSPRANKSAANLLIDLYVSSGEEKYLRLARKHYRLAAQLAPHELTPLIALLIIEQKSGGQFDPQAFDELVQRARTPHLPLTSLLAVRALVDCIHRGDCKVPVARMAELFRALLDNPTFVPRLRAVVFTLMADYSIKELEDYEQAFRYFDLALNIEPKEIIFHINRTKLLTISGQLNAARAALVRIEAMDRYGKFRSIVAAEYGRIERHAAQSKSKP